MGSFEVEAHAKRLEDTAARFLQQAEALRKSIRDYDVSGIEKAMAEAVEALNCEDRFEEAAALCDAIKAVSVILPLHVLTHGTTVKLA